MKPVTEYDTKRNTKSGCQTKILFSVSGRVVLLVNSRSLSVYPHHLVSLMAANKGESESLYPPASTRTYCKWAQEGTISSHVG